MFALVERSVFVGPAACPSGLRLVACYLVAPPFVLLRLFDLVALSDVEGIVSLGLLYCYRNLKSN